MGVRDIQKLINVRREARVNLEESLNQLQIEADATSSQRKWMRKAVKSDSNEGLSRETPKPRSADSYKEGKKWH